MKLGVLLAGLLFLVNPNVGVFDVLPDCIGYLLILRGMGALPDLVPALTDAKHGFMNLINVSLGRVAAMFFMLFADPSWTLVLVFTFFLLELWFSYKAFIPFFDGLSSAHLQYGEPVKKEQGPQTATMTYLFVFVKAALCLLPALTYLAESKTTGFVNLYPVESAANYRAVLTLGNVFVVTLLGLIWFFMLRSYLKTVNTPLFCEQANKAYQDKITMQKSFLIRKRFGLISKIMILGLLCMLALTINNINILPNAGFAIAAFLVLWMIQRNDLCERGKLTKHTKISAVLFLVASVLQYGLTIVFYSLYGLAESDIGFSESVLPVIMRNQTARVLFVVIIAATILEMLCFVFFYWLFVKVWKEIARVHTNIAYTEQERQLASQNEFTHKKNCRRLTITFALAVLLAVFSIVQRIAFFAMPGLWLLTFLCSIAFVAAAMTAFSALMEDIEAKYMLE
ncbi:MAG: hypothetical protein HFE78_02280 [Clostridiales bacterium]|nr:hypothetical protein [Clostridiales bacterium]